MRALRVLVVATCVVAMCVVAPLPGAATAATHAASTNAVTPHVGAGLAVHGAYEPVVGDFDCDFLDDIFWYATGRAADSVWFRAADGFASHPYTVNGSYRPVAGDFDGDGCDDIIWYVPGAGIDSLWFGSASKRFVSTSLQIYGNFTPIAGDFDGDDHADVWWFDPAESVNAIWYGGARGAFTAVRSHVPVAGTSAVRPVVADFDDNGHDDVLLYRPGSYRAPYMFGTDHRGSWSVHVSATPGDDLVPVAIDSSIFWYGPGAARDYLWRFAPYPAIGERWAVARSESYVMGTNYVPLFVPGTGLMWYVPGSGIRHVWWNVEREMPRPPPPHPTAIAAGGEHGCAVVEGVVKCWGANRFGELGNGTKTPSYLPTAVVGLPPGATSVVAGFGYTCAIVGGGAWCWGLNLNGELGNGKTIRSLVPVHVLGLDTGVTAISLSGNYAGREHTCAIVRGAAKCWGYNGDGALGDGTTTSRSTPVSVLGLGAGVASITSGDTASCAVVSGAAKCWGGNAQGQLGDGSTIAARVPVPVSGLATGVTSVSAGPQFACALTSGGAIKCWGDNDEGQLGDGSTIDRHAPVTVSGFAAGATAISSGIQATCAIAHMAHLVYCWGLTFPRTPVHVTGLTDGATALSAGVGKCAIVVRVAVCWGPNEKGQLGNGFATGGPAFPPTGTENSPHIVLHLT